MSRWQMFRHVLGLHDWHKRGASYKVDILIPRCGPFDPRPKTEVVRWAEFVCCQCGATKTVEREQWQ